MNIPAISSMPTPVSADAIPLERLSQSNKVSEQEKIRELSQQFEALLVRQVLKESRKSIIQSDLFGKSFSSDLYHDMMNDQLAKQISQSGSMGLAAQLEKDLSQRYQTPSTKGETRDQ